MAYSREPGVPRTYVQEALLNNSAMIATLLNHPGATCSEP